MSVTTVRTDTRCTQDGWLLRCSSRPADRPTRPIGRADEIAAAVLRLCGPGASLVVGVALPIDGGYTAR